MSILDDLHKGELYPSEQMIIEVETYRPAEERKEELLELLRGKSMLKVKNCLTNWMPSTATLNPSLKARRSSKDSELP